MALFLGIVLSGRFYLHPSTGSHKKRFNLLLCSCFIALFYSLKLYYTYLIYGRSAGIHSSLLHPTIWRTLAHFVHWLLSSRIKIISPFISIKNGS